MSKFKVGDRVWFKMDDRADFGIIIQVEQLKTADYLRYWIKWDSDGNVLHISGEFIELETDLHKAMNEEL